MRIRYFDVAAAVLLHGVFAHQQELPGTTAQILGELQQAGYSVPTAAEPVRIYPLLHSDPALADHAGGWKPGSIFLRPEPRGEFDWRVYLRHELFHEASWRTCRGNLPLWAEEAAALSFSGETSPAVTAPRETDTSDARIARLRSRVRTDATLTEADRATLRALVSKLGWEAAPCSIPRPFADLFRERNRLEGASLSYLVASVLSGRVLESGGDLTAPMPPGSLLKLPYAASLAPDHTAHVGLDLARSDTAALLARKEYFSPAVYRSLFADPQNLPIPAAGEGLNDTATHQLLGERMPDGSYPFESDLRTLMLLLRESLLRAAPRFRELSQNGVLQGSTLEHATSELRETLQKMHALAKTGTAANARDLPIAGHLMVAWPAEFPRYVAIFRQGRTSGAGTADSAAPLLKRLAASYPARAEVRVHLMSKLSPGQYHLSLPCPGFETAQFRGAAYQATQCGWFHLTTEAPGALPDRYVPGLLERRADNLILITDPDSYADGVLAAEAADLKGEARKALRAVIAFDGMNGASRHPDTHALCDTTHCMVYRGLPSMNATTDPSHEPPLAAYLSAIAAERQESFLLFSRGGTEPWSTTRSAMAVQAAFSAAAILGIQRERTRSGEVMVHLILPGETRTLACEVFRNTLKLLSCPESISFDASRDIYLFSGLGEGHGQGLDVERARWLAEQGVSAKSILSDAYSTNEQK